MSHAHSRLAETPLGALEYRTTCQVKDEQGAQTGCFPSTTLLQLHRLNAVEFKMTTD
jgi:hypothetical protein